MKKRWVDERPIQAEDRKSNIADKTPKVKAGGHRKPDTAPLQAMIRRMAKN